VLSFAAPELMMSVLLASVQSPKKLGVFFLLLLFLLTQVSFKQLLAAVTSWKEESPVSATNREANREYCDLDQFALCRLCFPCGGILITCVEQDIFMP
jgi:hypothetical protein